MALTSVPSLIINLTAVLEFRAVTRRSNVSTCYLHSLFTLILMFVSLSFRFTTHIALLEYTFKIHCMHAVRHDEGML
jgi:hypothetical protein